MKSKMLQRLSSTLNREKKFLQQLTKTSTAQFITHRGTDPFRADNRSFPVPLVAVPFRSPPGHPYVSARERAVWHHIVSTRRCSFLRKTFPASSIRSAVNAGRSVFAGRRQMMRRNFLPRSFVFTIPLLSGTDNVFPASGRPTTREKST